MCIYKQYGQKEEADVNRKKQFHSGFFWWWFQLQCKLYTWSKQCMKSHVRCVFGWTAVMASVLHLPLKACAPLRRPTTKLAEYVENLTCILKSNWGLGRVRRHVIPSHIAAWDPCSLEDLGFKLNPCFIADLDHVHPPRSLHFNLSWWKNHWSKLMEHIYVSTVNHLWACRWKEGAILSGGL